jgi:hypothetical protein
MVRTNRVRKVLADFKPPAPPKDLGGTVMDSIRTIAKSSSSEEKSRKFSQRIAIAGTLLLIVIACVVTYYSAPVEESAGAAGKAGKGGAATAAKKGEGAESTKIYAAAMLKAQAGDVKVVRQSKNVTSLKNGEQAVAAKDHLFVQAEKQITLVFKGWADMTVTGVARLLVMENGVNISYGKFVSNIAGS